MTISRDWATPITIGAFLLMAVTGILMFFHLDTGLNKEAHEGLGWGLVAGVGAHVVANWQAFMRHFKRPMAKGLMGLFLALLVGSFFVGKEGGGSPAGLAINTLTHASIKQLAGLRGEAPEAMVQRLQAAGFKVSGIDLTLSAITGQDRELTGKALRTALQPTGQAQP